MSSRRWRWLRVRRSVNAFGEPSRSAAFGAKADSVLAVRRYRSPRQSIPRPTPRSPDRPRTCRLVLRVSRPRLQRWRGVSRCPCDSPLVGEYAASCRMKLRHKAYIDICLNVWLNNRELNDLRSTFATFDPLCIPERRGFSSGLSIASECLSLHDRLHGRPAAFALIPPDHRQRFCQRT